MSSKRGSTFVKQRDSALAVPTSSKRESTSSHSSTVFVVDPFNFHSKRDSSSSQRSSVSDFLAARKRDSKALGSDALFKRDSSFSIGGDGNEIVFDFDHEELAELLLRLTSPEHHEEMDEKAIKETIEKGADVNFFEEGLGCPLQNAIFGKNVNVVRLLLNSKASVNTSNAFLASPLSVALHFNAGLDMVKLLTDSKANLHDRMDSSTILHNLASAVDGDKDLIPIAQHLIQLGSWDYVMAFEKNKTTAAELATASKKDQLAVFLTHQERECRDLIRTDLTSTCLSTNSPSSSSSAMHSSLIDLILSYCFSE